VKSHTQDFSLRIFSDDEVELEAKRAGTSLFLRKPDDFDSIPETVVRLLARKKGRETSA